MDILENEYGDYPRNWWHYDSEYKMLIEAQTQAWKQANEAAEQHEQALPMCGVMPRTTQDDYITLVKPTYLAKDGSIKMAREIVNDIGETIRYEALKSDMYGA